MICGPFFNRALRLRRRHYNDPSVSDWHGQLEVVDLLKKQPQTAFSGFLTEVEGGRVFQKCAKGSKP